MKRWIFVIALAAGCGKDDKPAGPSASSRGGVIETWRKGGLAPSAFAPATVAFGKDCQSGAVNNVETMLCEFPSEAEAKAAEEQGFEWVGETTGISRAAGKVLIVAADRKKADPSGRTLNQMTKLLMPATPPPPTPPTGLPSAQPTK